MTFLRAMVIAGLLGVANPTLAEEPVMDQRLVDAEHLYRTDGPAEALPEFTRLLQVFEENNETPNIALAQGYIGACHWRLGNYEQSREHLDIALRLKRDIGDELQVAKTLNVLGLLEWDLGNFDQAIDNFTQATAIGEKTGDARLQGATLNNLSLVYDELGDYQTSLDQYQHVLEIYSGADFPRGMSDTLGNIGGVYLLLGQFTEAARYYTRALEISEQLESVSSMSQDHGNLGLANTGMGATDKALQHFDKALEFARQAGLQKEQGQWLRGKADAQIMAGKYDLGLESSRTALATLESVGAQTQLLDALYDIGQLSLMLGDPVSAEQYFQRAIALAREIGMSRIITINLVALGDLQYRHRRFEEAAALYAQALQRAEEAGEQSYYGQALLRLARVHRDQRDFIAGTSAGKQALELARSSGARSIEAEALYMLAELDRAQGNIEAALQGYKDADQLSREIGDPDLQWQIDYGRGMAFEQSGSIEEAITALEAAIGVIESVRNRLREKRYRAGYLQDKHQVYIELVRLQMQLSRTRDAFQTAERLRTWSYIEQTGLMETSELSEEQQRARIELRERIGQLQRNLEDERTRVVPEQRQLAIDTFSSELLLAEREFLALLDDTSSQAAGFPTATEQAGEAAIQSHLHPDEALIEYVVGEQNLTIFVLTANNLRAIDVKASQNDLHSRLELLRNLLEQRDNERWKIPARSLAKTLLQPILENGWINGVKHLYLVPHGMLNYLPFALLPVEVNSQQHAIIERYTLAYLPTASSLDNGSVLNHHPQTLLAMAPAISRLEYAAEEVRSIGALFGANAQLMLGLQATESMFKARAGEFQFLHLATHSYFNKLNPMLSGLQLEADNDNDGLLEVHEILELKLKSDLITLSACKTGLGSGYFSAIPAGDDFIGMTRAFLQVGSASVLATLWEVEDRSTVDLMKSFYGHLDTNNSGQNKADALASAQRVLLASNNYKHPYYWAPFVLVGSMSQTSTSSTTPMESPL